MPAKFSYLTALSLPLLPMIPLLACGGDDDGKLQPDAAPVTPDAPAVTCTAEASYSPMLSSMGSGQIATNYPAKGTGSAAEPHVISYLGGMNADIDGLRILLFQGFGGFGTGDIKTGTYTLTGDEAKFSTCGICVLVATNITQAAGVTDYYMANSGTLELTSVGGAQFNGQFTGTLTNATFAHVGKDMNLPTDMSASNCMTAVTSATFNVALMQGSAAGKTTDALVLRKRYY